MFRSKSCPQCRAKSSENNICRIYFNVHDTATEDTNTLQNKIDSLECNMLLKNTEIKKCNEEIATFNKKDAGQKNEIKRLKDEVQCAKYNNLILKEHFSILNKRNKFLEPVLTENERLQKKVQSFRNIETVINGSSEEVDEMLKNYGDSSEATKSLVTFTSVLKKEMQNTVAKNKELSTKLYEAESKVYSLTEQVRRLEERIKFQKVENDYFCKKIGRAAEKHASLKKKIDALQQTVVSPTASYPCTSALKPNLAESPAPEYLKRACLDDSSGENLATSPDPTSPPATVKEIPPHLKIKSLAYGQTPLRLNQTKITNLGKFSIFRKNRMDSLMEGTAPPNDEEYDGMGGHSKLDEFPRRIPHIKVKKVDKYHRLSKIKLKDAIKVNVASNNLKMDLFLKKLLL